MKRCLDDHFTRKFHAGGLQTKLTNAELKSLEIEIISQEVLESFHELGSVNNFAPLSLVFLQKQWIEKGHATEIYAELDFEKAAKVAREIG